jgi:hypothetical protein
MGELAFDAMKRDGTETPARRGFRAVGVVRSRRVWKHQAFAADPPPARRC